MESSLNWQKELKTLNPIPMNKLAKRYLSSIGFILACSAIALHAQNQVDSTFSLADHYAKMSSELRPGVFKDGDKVYISEDSKRLLTDSVYRASIFPKAYSFEVIPTLIEQGKTQLALWYLVNLFDQNELLTLQIARELLGMNIKPRNYLSAFYSYVFADPEIMSFENGTMTLMYPERLEKKTQVVNYLAEFSAKIKVRSKPGDK